MTVTARELAASGVDSRLGPEFGAALGELAASSEPRIVFTSLAAISVSLFSDCCLVFIEEDDGSSWVVTGRGDETGEGTWDGADLCARLADGSGERVTADAVHTPVLGGSVGDRPGYRGLVTHGWRTGRPGAIEAALAVLVVERAIAVIESARLRDGASVLQHRAHSLQLALVHSREIGAAIGILMVTERITYPAGFDRLRTASQHTHRKLNDVAAEVVLTGALPFTSAPRPSASPRPQPSSPQAW